MILIKVKLITFNRVMFKKCIFVFDIQEYIIQTTRTSNHSVADAYKSQYR